MKVKAVMRSDVATCIPETKLTEVARLMWDGDTGFVAVIDPLTQVLVGVITDRDALMAAYTTGQTLEALTARVGMAKVVKTCSPEDQIEAAEQMMGEFRVHRLPVVDEQGKIAGVLSLNEIARKAAEEGDEFLEQEVGLTLGAICRPRAQA